MDHLLSKEKVQREVSCLVLREQSSFRKSFFENRITEDIRNMIFSNSSRKNIEKQLK